ncbi:SAM-dependent methyltransferase [Rhodococcus rhodochrous]|uniref:SAM-dependent methyltransferase n=1 Tax=Rhodococcus rhodochrous TaxID=1829 RepID=UPI001320E518|nr:class I SAM-dependent methyltransferase [Rhodococcus rhodochrous]MCD2098813.1 class I SAM-dependent methyltransferase [Rhodococcus rhodochrous]MCD2123309.1 class I SAM-dependent methyltransferase [Rhodococcus rhodochrous]MCQ4136055.1 class I SAM-dependent methyltransferase [Rhodococcus rhodochrous]MDJ0019977.1 class I SAM-dependent methyltransferase [Rhodococcus rhodochrous]MXQ75216.1 methyltransferase domain-containing protein [Rhodococcus rhodochrous]
MDARDWNEKYAASELIWGAPPNPVIVEHVASLPHGRALDLGCGEGRHSLWLATRGWEVVGVDFSEVALDKARRIAAQAPSRSRDRLRYVLADVTADSFEGEYDLILSAFLHFPPPQRKALLDRAINSLKPEGILIFLGHDTINVDEGVGGPQDKEILYTPTDLVEEIDGRLEIGIAERRYRETDAGTAIDALVVASKPPLGS